MIRMWIIVDKRIPSKRYLSLLSSMTLILPEFPETEMNMVSK